MTTVVAALGDYATCVIDDDGDDAMKMMDASFSSPLTLPPFSLPLCDFLSH